MSGGGFPFHQRIAGIEDTVDELHFVRSLVAVPLDFHAAQARDAGYTRYRFFNQVVSDLISIQAYPPELRWFIQDQDDESLLVSADEQVFDEPVKPDLHHDSFLQTCFTCTSSFAR